MDPPSPRRTTLARFWPWVLLLVSGLLLAWILQRANDPRWTRELETPERAALYERTLQNLETVCREPSSPAQAGFCREQATLIVALPECDEACRNLAQPHLSQPTR